MSDKPLENQRALLLFHLFIAKESKLTKGEANSRLTDAQRRNLNLPLGAANQLRAELAHGGYIQKSKRGRAEILELTDKGVAYLAELRHADNVNLKMTGKDLNALLDAVQRLREEWKETVAQSVAIKPSSLEAAILSEFRELIRERYSHRRMVPIHEVRRQIAAKLGPQAARHDAFDPAVQRLRQDKKLEMLPISDPREATTEQLNDSIPGVNETHFYLEPIHEHAVAF